MRTASLHRPKTIQQLHYSNAFNFLMPKQDTQQNLSVFPECVWQLSSQKISISNMKNIMFWTKVHKGFLKKKQTAATTTTTT